MLLLLTDLVCYRLMNIYKSKWCAGLFVTFVTNLVLLCTCNALAYTEQHTVNLLADHSIYQIISMEGLVLEKVNLFFHYTVL